MVAGGSAVRSGRLVIPTSVAVPATRRGEQAPEQVSPPTSAKRTSVLIGATVLQQTGQSVGRTVAPVEPCRWTPSTLSRIPPVHRNRDPGDEVGRRRRK